MNRKLILKKSQVFAWIMFFIWFPMTSIVDTYSIWFNMLKLIVCGYTVLKGINGKKMEYKYVLIWLYLLILIYSTYKQHNSRNILLAIVYSVGILSVFYYFKAKPFLESVAAFYPIATVYIIFNAISVFFTENGLTQNSWDQANYLIGGKFSVFYLSLIWLVTFLCLSKKDYSKMLLTCIFVGLSLISLKTDCSTGVFCLFIVFCILIFTKIQALIFKPIALIGITASLNIIIVAYNRILQSGIAAYVVQDILHRNLNLTGRTEIYESFFLLIKKDIVWGLGYNNTLVSSNLGYLNAQNGFLDVISKCGLVGLVLFVGLFAMAIFNSYHSSQKDRCLFAVWPIMVAFIVASVVEISFNMYFFFIVAICFALKKNVYAGSGGNSNG